MLAIGVHKPGSPSVASSHKRSCLFVVIKPQLVHATQDAITVPASTGWHTSINTVKKKWKDLILVVVKKDHSF
jgi:hypothetical protein